MQIAFDVDEATDIDATYANVNERAFAIAKAASQPPGTFVCPLIVAAHACGYNTGVIGGGSMQSTDASSRSMTGLRPICIPYPFKRDSPLL